MITDLKILDTVDICIIDNVKDKKTYYKTTIIDKSDGNIFYTGYINNLNSNMLSSNNRSIDYELYYRTAKGIFCWNVIYLGNKKLDTVYTSEFKAISNPVKTQNREFYRQPICLSISFTINDKQASDKESLNVYTGTMVNISGGGCAFTSQYTVSSNTLINIKFKYKNSIYYLIGRVLCNKKFPASTLYEYRVQWENNNSKIIDDVIKLLFTIQRDKKNQ